MVGSGRGRHALYCGAALFFVEFSAWVVVMQYCAAEHTFGPMYRDFQSIFYEGVNSRWHAREQTIGRHAFVQFPAVQLAIDRISFDAAAAHW